MTEASASVCLLLATALLYIMISLKLYDLFYIAAKIRSTAIIL